MQPTNIETLKFPIGKFEYPETLAAETIQSWINDIEELPLLIKAEVEGLGNETLLQSYRPGGWTIQQLVNHCADSHMNALTRFKLALTEDNPTIKPYAEALWAELPDTLELPVSISIQMLEGIHAKLTILLKSLSEEQLQRTFTHPEYMRTQTLAFTIGSYAWHGRHHLAHIQLAKRSSQ